MPHFHLKHDHNHNWLDLLTLDASDATALVVRRRMGYPDGITFFEEAPAGVLVHEALTVLLTPCDAGNRESEEQRSSPAWAIYETNRDFYLLASLVFGRADLLAAVLLDCSRHTDAWALSFKPGEVHRTLPSSALDLLIDETPANVLNLMLVTDLQGDLYQLPVWVAILLAARPNPRRYGSLLRRLATSGATGFRQHLVGKHPVLMNRAAIDKAVEDAERLADKVAYRNAQRTAERQGTARSGAPAEPTRKDEDVDLLDHVRDLFDSINVRPTTGSDPETDAIVQEIMDDTNRAVEEAARREHDLNTALAGASEAVHDRIAGYHESTYLSSDDEDKQRERLGLPPRTRITSAHLNRRRVLESRLLGAIRNGRLKEVSKALLDGADPDTAVLGDGSAMVAAILHRQVKTVRMLLAHGANPALRYEGYSMLSYVAKYAGDVLKQDFDDREGLEDALDPYVQIQGLLVRAGATADQLNGYRDEGTYRPHPVERDGWHFLRLVPPLREAYEDAVDERKAAIEEADRALASMHQAIKDHPELERKAALDVKAMLAQAKGTR